MDRSLFVSLNLAHTLSLTLLTHTLAFPLTHTFSPTLTHIPSPFHPFPHPFSTYHSMFGASTFPAFGAVAGTAPQGQPGAPSFARVHPPPGNGLVNQAGMDQKMELLRALYKKDDLDVRLKDDRLGTTFYETPPVNFSERPLNHPVIHLLNHPLYHLLIHPLNHLVKQHSR